MDGLATIPTVAVILYTAGLVYAAASDVATFTIPNWLSLAIVADFLVAALAASSELATIGWHLSAGLAVLAAGAGLFAAGILGGGDAKLLAAAAVWVGWPSMLKFILAVSIIGGALAFAIILLRWTSLPRALMERQWIRRIHSRAQGLPYGVAIALGGLAVLVETPLAAPVVEAIFGL